VPDWVLVSRPDVADPARELGEVIYCVPGSTRLEEGMVINFMNGGACVDWVYTLENLKRLGHDLVYTEDMMRACLLRLINRFHHNFTGSLWPKTANEVARCLLKRFFQTAGSDNQRFYTGILP
jgi:hypothetical protein